MADYNPPYELQHAFFSSSWPGFVPAIHVFLV
jgi:hypothetical protein